MFTAVLQRLKLTKHMSGLREAKDFVESFGRFELVQPEIPFFAREIMAHDIACFTKLLRNLSIIDRRYTFAESLDIVNALWDKRQLNYSVVYELQATISNFKKATEMRQSRS